MVTNLYNKYLRRYDNIVKNCVFILILKKCEKIVHVMSLLTKKIQFCSKEVYAHTPVLKQLALLANSKK